MHLKAFPVFKTFIKDHKNIKAMAFDMDGTLLNTEHLHAQAHLNLVNIHSSKQKSYDLDKMIHRFIGIDDPTVFKELQSERMLCEKQSFEDFQILKNNEISNILNMSNSESFISTSIIDFIKEAKENGIKIFLVTSSERELCEELLRRFEMYDLFDFITTRNDVEMCKPHPQPYLQTFNSNNINPNESIVFEDSDAGHTSGTASGAITYKVSWYLN